MSGQGNGVSGADLGFKGTQCCLVVGKSDRLLFQLDQAREALARVAARHTRGKIALQIG